MPEKKYVLVTTKETHILEYVKEIENSKVDENWFDSFDDYSNDEIPVSSKRISLDVIDTKIINGVQLHNIIKDDLPG